MTKLKRQSKNGLEISAKCYGDCEWMSEDGLSRKKADVHTQIGSERKIARAHTHSRFKYILTD